MRLTKINAPEPEEENAPIVFAVAASAETDRHAANIGKLNSLGEETLGVPFQGGSR
jgi:hypothetical protein